jgi:hypothetical protein
MYLLPLLISSDFFYQIIFPVLSKWFCKPSQKMEVSMAPGHIGLTVSVHNTKKRTGLSYGQGPSGPPGRDKMYSEKLKKFKITLFCY